MELSEEKNDINDNRSKYFDKNPHDKNLYTTYNNIKKQKYDCEHNSRQKNASIVQKVADASKRLVALATMVTGLAVCVGIDTILPSDNLVGVDFFDVYGYGTEVSYSVSLENFDEDKNVFVVLYNDFTNRVERIDDNIMEGTFEDLQTDMTYTFVIKQDSKVIASKTVRTGYNRSDDKPTGNG